MNIKHWLVNFESWTFVKGSTITDKRAKICELNLPLSVYYKIPKYDFFYLVEADTKS